jgi:thiamine pyrophosphokinase
VVAALVFPRASPALVREHLPAGARVIAIDAGAESLRVLGVRPDRVVGDMDSVTPETLAHFERLGVAIERHPARKRDSDAAIALAAVHGEEDIVLLGPGGGRADHALANLHLLAAMRGRARAVDEDAFTWIVTPERPLVLHRPAGSLLSVLPFDTRCEGVTFASMEYMLHDATMLVGDPYGLSNVCGPPPQKLEVRQGRLVVIAPR